MSTTSAPAAIPANASPAPTEMSISQILQSEAWRSPTPTSVPDNTPEEHLTPQLARRTNPLIEEDSESISAIDYSSRVEDETEDVAPAGYVFNDPQCGHFYPIYVANPKFGETRTEPHIAMAKYVKYATDYTYIRGMMGIGHEVHTIPVTVRRRACFYACMTEENWRELQRDNEHEFAVNKVLSQLGDHQLTGEVNRYHTYQEMLNLLE